MLEVGQVGFSFASTRVLDDVSMDVKGGEVVALLGPNGAGKSTLVSLLIGARKPAAGSILLHGCKPRGRHGSRHRIGWVPQAITLYPRLTVVENLRALGRIMGLRGQALADGVDRALQLSALAAKREQRVEALSGGQQRLLNIGMALVHSPDLLILDEPTAGVDRSANRHLKRMIRELRQQGLAILLTTHELEDADELADRLVILVDGKVRAAGKTDRVIQSVFTDQREVSVHLAPAESDREALRRCRERLGAAGLLAGDCAEQWLGLLDNSQRQVDDLLHDLLGYGRAIREVRVRQPSLEMLIHRLSVAGNSS